MNEVEEFLKQSSGTQPQRPLRATFTKDIVDYLQARPKRAGWLSRFKESITMKFLTKPAVAVAALAVTIIATGGVAYAAIVGWPQVSALFGGQQLLPGGDRLVKVNTENCTYINAFNIGSGQLQDTLYYRVKANSKLSNEQVVQMVKGNCYVEEQARFDGQVVSATLDRNPLNKDRVVAGYIDSLVTAVSSSSISLESVMPTGGQLKNIKQTFNNIAPDVLVYASPKQISLSDIKVGDHVSIKYRASGDALNHSETMPLDQLNTNEQVLVAIIKNSADMTAAVNYQKYNGQEFEQVVPCKSQPSGYCNLEQYLKQ